MKKYIEVLLNLAYWAMFLLLLLFFYLLLIPLANYVGKPAFLQQALLGWLMLMSGFAIVPALISFYMSYYFLFNRFLLKRRILLLFLTGLITGILASVLGLSMLSLIYKTNLFLKAGIPVLMVMSFGAVVNGVLGLVIRGFITSYKDITLKEMLRRKNEETELELIKAQLQPHFLFNTINNIDVLIKKDPEAASLYLNKLSDILRFMLYETKTEKVALEKELDTIRRYIDLQKIRTSNTNYISLITPEETTGIEVAPMLYLGFIENAFKHAGNKKIDQAIRVRFETANGKIFFECINHFPDKSQKHPEAGGLGNELIRKRLELLYPGTHVLEITEKDNLYTVQLTVPAA